MYRATLMLVRNTRAKWGIGVVAAIAVVSGLVALFVLTGAGPSLSASVEPADAFNGGVTTTRDVNLPSVSASEEAESPRSTDTDGITTTACGQMGRSERQCDVLTPPGIGPTERLPVVILLHGFRQQPENVIADGGWRDALLSARLVLVAPFGVEQSWNAGGCCGRAESTGVDDAAFLDQVIDRISLRSDVDTSRIFMVGESNGAMMVHRYLCGSRHRLAGAASVAGTSVADCPPIVSFPFIEIHGLADVTVPAAGGTSENVLVDGTTFAPVLESVQAVAASAGCANQAVANSIGAVDVLDWSGCRDGASVRYAMLRNRGHEWPTTPAYSATNEILRFFGLVP